MEPEAPGCQACLSPAPAPRPSNGSSNANPPGISFLQLLLEDYRTYDRRLLEPALWAVALHRFANWRMNIRSRVLRLPFTLTYRFCHRALVWFLGIDICLTTRLGRRVRIWHNGAIFLSCISIGDDVHIRHSTTFGVAAKEEPHRKAIIEDRVDVGVGVCVLGAVTVGHDSVIGANSVVVRDVPPHSTVFGVPARRINLRPLPSNPSSVP